MKLEKIKILHMVLWWKREFLILWKIFVPCENMILQLAIEGFASKNFGDISQINFKEIQLLDLLDLIIGSEVKDNWKAEKGIGTKSLNIFQSFVAFIDWRFLIFGLIHMFLTKVLIFSSVKRHNSSELVFFRGKLKKNLIFEWY